jgi:hypothetical protein
LPVIVLGWAGTVDGVTAKVRGVFVHPLFDGITCIFPEPAPTVTVTELVVPPAVCAQPDGKVHR